MQMTSRSKCKISQIGIWKSSDPAVLVVNWLQSGKRGREHSGDGDGKKVVSEQKISLQRQPWRKKGERCPTSPAPYTLSSSPSPHLWGEPLVRALSCSLRPPWLLWFMCQERWWWQSWRYHPGCSGVSPVPRSQLLPLPAKCPPLLFPCLLEELEQGTSLSLSFLRLTLL